MLTQGINACDTAYDARNANHHSAICCIKWQTWLYVHTSVLGMVAHCPTPPPSAPLPPWPPPSKMFRRFKKTQESNTARYVAATIYLALRLWYVHICLCIWIWFCLSICVCICTSIWMCMCICTCTCICRRIVMYVYMYIHTRMSMYRSI